MTAPISIAGPIRWVGTMQAGRVVIQAVTLLVLARLLPTEAFGTMALAMVAVSFANLFGDMGTAAAIIQQRRLSQARTSAVFWFNVGIGIVLGAILCLLAPLLAKLLDAPDLARVLISLSPSFLIGGASITHQALLERDSRFRMLAGQSILAGILGAVAGVAGAYAGLGVYSLVLQSLVGAVVSCAVLWKLSVWRPDWHVDLSELREIRHFSGNVFMASLMNFVHRNADALIIGRAFGAAQLGLYSMAYRLMMFPLQNLTFAFNRAAFPAYSRTQDSPAAVATHYLASLRKIAFLTAPTMGVAWLAREPLISLVLGAKWSGSAGVFAWLAPVGFVQSAISTSGAVLQALDETRTLRNLTLVGTPLLVGSFLAGLPWGIEGVAMAYCAANVIWLFPVMHAVMGKLGGTLAQALVAILAPAGLMLLLFGAAFLYLHVSDSAPTSLEVLLATAVAAAIYAACVAPAFARRIAAA